MGKKQKSRGGNRSDTEGEGEGAEEKGGETGAGGEKGAGSPSKKALGAGSPAKKAKGSPGKDRVAERLKYSPPASRRSVRSCLMHPVLLPSVSGPIDPLMVLSFVRCNGPIIDSMQC